MHYFKGLKDSIIMAAIQKIAKKKYLRKSIPCFFEINVTINEIFIWEDLRKIVGKSLTNGR